MKREIKFRSFYNDKSMLFSDSYVNLYHFFELKPEDYPLMQFTGLKDKNGLVGKECHVIENWKGMKIELFVDRNVKMMGSYVDGVRIKPLQPIEKVKPNFTEANFESAKKANATIEQIKKSYNITKEIEDLWNKL